MESVRGSYREQNSVFKADDFIIHVRMFQHGLTRNRPTDVGVPFPLGCGVPCCRFARRREGNHPLAGDWQRLPLIALAARYGQHGAFPSIRVEVAKSDGVPSTDVVIGSGSGPLDPIVDTMHAVGF